MTVLKSRGCLGESFDSVSSGEGFDLEWMSRHDVAMQVVGQPARDLARHFVQR